MSKTAQPQSPQYELKHRVTGAAILVILAVAGIPLLLSEPNLEANTTESINQGKFDKTFKSRIVPLNINNVNNDEGGDRNLDSVEIDRSKPALVDLTQPANEALSGGQNQDTSAVVMTIESNSGESAEAPTKESQVDKSVPTTSVEGQTEEVKSVSNQIDGNQSESKKSATTIAKLEQQDTGIDSGWIVRVGTFSKQANVDSVSSLLTNSGFKPKTSGVTTSLGESTRVWLGPYAKRETADKISDRLKDLIGEKGYVTRTSS